MQLAYSDLDPQMLDEAGRRRKAAKIREVLKHFLGRADLSGLVVLDVGSSTGFISDELANAGARVVGVDIDVPGLTRATARFGDRVAFVCADGTRMPFADDAFDVVLLNQIYQHVVDPAGLMAELRRVVRTGGVAYFGLANRVTLVEPHYHLPLLSLIPRRFAHHYVRLSGRAEHYHEQLKSYSQLRRMCRGWQIWDYSVSALRNPQLLLADDAVPKAGTLVPAAVYRALRPLLPSYIWVGVNGAEQAPAGATMPTPPTRLGLIPLS